MELGSRFLRHLPGQISCRDFEQFVFDYSEAQLTPRQRRIFELHMRFCPRCRAHFLGYLRAIELGRRVFDREEDEAVPADVPEELVRAILAARAER